MSGHISDNVFPAFGVVADFLSYNKPFESFFGLFERHVSSCVIVNEILLSCYVSVWVGTLASKRMRVLQAISLNLLTYRLFQTMRLPARIREL